MMLEGYGGMEGLPPLFFHQADLSCQLATNQGHLQTIVVCLKMVTMAAMGTMVTMATMVVMMIIIILTFTVQVIAMS